MNRRLFLGVLLVLLGGVGLAARAELRVLQTRHYRVHTDVEPALAEDLGRMLDRLYDEYERRLADFERGQARRLEVYVFDRKADYVAFVGNGAEHTGGMFIPTRGLLAAYRESQGRDGLRQTLQHEAFHQFAHQAISPNLPIWLNEGLAQWFEEGLWTAQGFQVGQVPPRRLRLLEADINGRRLFKFRTLMELDAAGWSANMSDPLKGATQYNQSWAMVHFLIDARDESGRYRFRQRLLAMLRAIHEGQPADEAFRGAFSDNIEGFQQRFLEWCKTLTSTPEATYADNQRILADMLVLCAKEGRRFADAREFRAAVVAGRMRLNYSRAQMDWSTAEDPSVYFSNAEGDMTVSGQLRFESRSGAPLPDLVCSPAAGVTFRTRFYDAGGERVEHETRIDVPRARTTEVRVME